MQFTVKCIIDGAHSAAFNMAADLHLMQQSVEEECMYLRLYRWKPAGISIGSLQHASEQLNLPMLASDGIDWVRRPTGGRAVLHSEDLTYSCVFPKSIAATGSTVAATYTLIMRCLVYGLSTLGITPEVHDSVDPLIKSGRHVKLPCFLAPNRNEIMISGRKLIGSAQYRSQVAVLQHGSIPLSTAYTKLPDYLLINEDEKELQRALLQQKSISIAEIAPSVTPEELATALRSGFMAVLKMPFVDSPFSPHTLQTIQTIAESGEFIQQRLCDPN